MENLAFDTNLVCQKTVQSATACKELLIKEVMKEVLGREPKECDHKSFYFIKHDKYPNREFFAHVVANLLGEITFKVKPDSIEFSFVPMDKFPEHGV